jgi:hypothetical protein
MEKVSEPRWGKEFSPAFMDFFLQRAVAEGGMVGATHTGDEPLDRQVPDKSVFVKELPVR